MHASIFYMNIIYIAGLSHSGSTIFDMLLSSHHQVIGVGELISAVHKKDVSREMTKDYCSCGSTMTLCPFWKKVISSNADTSIKKYNEVLEEAKSKGFGCLVDSSKKISGLQIWCSLRNNQDLDLRVVYMYKDPRAYAYSMAKKRKKVGKKWIPSVYFLHKWWRQMKQLKKYISEQKLPVLVVSYENLVTNTDGIIGKVYDWADLPEYNEILDCKNSHVSYGNRTKKTFKSVPILNLDDVWKSNIYIWYYLLPHVCISNISWKYKSI